jgi:AraC-like DNA-binding protein
MNMNTQTAENVSLKMRSIWNTLESVFQAKLTIHDHAGVFTMPDGINLLPAVNIHKNNCCAYWYASRERCNKHCNFGAARRATEEKSPFVFTCFCGVTELVMPLFAGNSHVATIFAGMFKRNDFDLSDYPLRYRRLYDQLPEWNDDMLPYLETLLTSAGYTMISLAENMRKNYRIEQGRNGEIRNFFRTRYAENPTVADLAETLDLSESRTVHILLEIFQKGFSQLLNEERLTHVVQLLEETQLPLRKIAEMTGFNNEYYLSTVFKKYYGMPPGQKRNKTTNKL